MLPNPIFFSLPCMCASSAHHHQLLSWPLYDEEQPLRCPGRGRAGPLVLGKGACGEGLFEVHITMATSTPSCLGLAFPRPGDGGRLPLWPSPLSPDPRRAQWSELLLARCSASSRIRGLGLIARKAFLAPQEAKPDRFSQQQSCYWRGKEREDDKDK